MNRYFHFKALSLSDTTMYKGLAILSIMLHNFFHWILPKVGENEENFSLDRVERFMDLLGSEPVRALFSFFGHYGVQMFLFLSAYGLTKRYYHDKIDFFPFIFKRLLKIYPAFFFSILVWALYVGMLHGGIPHTLLLFHTYGQALLYKITLVSNFIPGELYNVNGPWWFLSLIVQFYLLFPLLLWSEKRYGSKVLVLIALGALIMIAMLQPYVDISLTGTVLAHLPELCLGIYFATQKKVSMHYGVIALVALVFILSSFYPFFWYFSFSSVLLLMLVVGQLLFMKVNDWFKSKMLFLGTISMYIFYINGFMRSPWIENANAYKSWYVSLLLSLLFVVLVVAVAYVMWRVSSYLLRVKRN